MKQCTVAVSYTDESSGVFILGDTFLRNFITIFDYKTGNIELAQTYNTPPGVTVEYKMHGWKIFALIMLGFFASVLLVSVFYCCYSKCK